MKTKLTLIFMFMTFCGVAHANDPPLFGFPVDCKLGTDCWTVNYVDVDPSPENAKDFRCQTKTYEGHKGTDFAIRSRIEMEQGVNVLAAKDGKVLRLRDGQDDLPKTEEQYQNIRRQNTDCGNGIVIDHGDGLSTYYCHLKKGSILVKPGDQVKEGSVIAQIGQSGFSEFPHLHFTIIWENGHMDPFTGMLKDDGCGEYKGNMWKDNLQYEPYTIFDGGFDGKIPNWEAIEAGQAPIKTLKITELDRFIYWVGFYHAQQGDQINLIIRDPNGQIFAQRNRTLENDRKRPSFYYVGRKLGEKTLIPGTYTGEITYTKAGFNPKTVKHTIEIE